jgi:hypothetical protein
MPTHNDGVTRDLTYWLNNLGELQAALAAEIAREGDAWVLVSISAQPARDTAAIMVLFQGSRDACMQMMDRLPPEGGSDMLGVEHKLAMAPLSDWKHLGETVEKFRRTGIWPDVTRIGS